MILDPRHLHALAELHSLAAVWPRLERAQRGVQLAAAMSGDRGTLRSPTYGSRGAGGIANPVLEAIADANDRRAAPTKRLAESVASTVRWLAELTNVSQPSIDDSLAGLRRIVPRMHPETAANLGLHIAEADGQVREHLGLGDDHTKLTGVRCPACRTRRIEVRTSNPALDARPYVCGAGCTCAGDGCPCGMAVPTADVTHIWLRPELVAAVKKEAGA